MLLLVLILLLSKLLAAQSKRKTILCRIMSTVPAANAHHRVTLADGDHGQHQWLNNMRRVFIHEVIVPPNSTTYGSF